MAVDLLDLIPALKVAVNPPGSDLFSTTTNEEWVLRLENAFWNARLDGLFSNYRAESGAIEPVSGTTDITRDALQLVILYAGLDVVLSELRNAQSAFKAVAGPVSYETQRSAQLLREVLMTIRARINQIIYNLSTLGVADSYAIDAVIARTESIGAGDSWWVK